MRSEWNTHILGDIAEFKYGKMPNKELLNSGVVPTFSGYKYQYTYPEKNCRKGDVIVVARGVGGTGDVKIVREDCYLTNLSILISLDEREIYKPYIFQHYRQATLRHLDSGSAQSQITINDLAREKITVPTLQTQKAIAHILGSLDDKIELNRQINQTLESMAQALFKSWFVDFDPVIDNALAAGNPIPEALQARTATRQAAAAGSKDNKSAVTSLPAELRQQFPNEFEFTEEMGWVPKGWAVTSLDAVGRNKRENIAPENLKEGSPYIALSDMPRGSISLNEWGDVDDVGSNKFAFEKNDILFGKLRPYFHKVGVAPVGGVCSTDILVVQPCRKELFGLVLGYVSSKKFIDYVTAGSSGTRMPRTSWSEMAKYPVLLPDDAIARLFNMTCSDIVEKIMANNSSSRSTVKIRDTLLPKLISGELRIPDAEKLVSEAGL